MATSAQEEFHELMREKDHRLGHPDNDDDDNNDARSFLHLSDSEGEHDDDVPTTSSAAHEDDNPPPPRPSISQARNTIPLTRYAANTGPKGVIADAQNFRDSRRLHRVSMRNGVAGVRPAPVDLRTFTEKEDSRANGRSNGHMGNEKEEDGEDDEDVDDLVDDEFMRKWRLTRLEQLRNGSSARDASETTVPAHHKSAPPQTRIWDEMPTVDGSGYLDAVDNSPLDVVVLVYIYDDESEVSLLIEDCLRELAQLHTDLRFVRLHFEDAEMEPAGVPALLAYRGGDKFAGLVPMIQEIPDDADLDALTLEGVLRRHGILR